MSWRFSYSPLNRENRRRTRLKYLVEASIPVEEEYFKFCTHTQMLYVPSISIKQCFCTFFTFVSTPSIVVTLNEEIAVCQNPVQAEWEDLYYMLCIIVTFCFLLLYVYDSNDQLLYEGCFTLQFHEAIFL